MSEKHRIVHVSLLQEIIATLNDNSVKTKTIKYELQSIIDDELNYSQTVKEIEEQNATK